MKAKVPILLYFFFVILIFGCQREKKEFRCVITTYYEPFRCVITTYYEPISHNGEWVCGKEHKIDVWKDVFPDTTFYDEYDNVMLKIINLEHTRKIVNNTYFSPKEKKLMKQNVWCVSNWDKKPEEGIIDFIRNEKGLLVEQKIYGEIDNYLISDIVSENPVIYKYDDTGRRIEAIETENTRKETIKYLPEDKGLLVVTSQVIDSNVKYYYQNTKGLVEQKTWIYNSTKPRLLQREIKEYYTYGYFNSKTDITYSYNKENQLIREYSKEEYAERFPGHPGHLYGEKLDKFMEDKFSKITDYDHEYYNSISNKEYNGYGDIISITDSTQTIRNRHKQSDTNSIFDATNAWNNEIQRKWRKRVNNKYEYEYNKKNDWTKSVTLKFRYFPFNKSDATLQENGGKYVADLICVRKILYGEEAKVLYDKYITIENSINK